MRIVVLNFLELAVHVPCATVFLRRRAKAAASSAHATDDGDAEYEVVGKKKKTASHEAVQGYEQDYEVPEDGDNTYEVPEDGDDQQGHAF